MDVFELLALKGTRKILLELQQRQKVRYSDLVRVVGHSTTTSRALSSMENLDIVTKEVLQEKYRPVVYSLTENGKRLSKILIELTSLEKTLLSTSRRDF